MTKMQLLTFAAAQKSFIPCFGFIVYLSQKLLTTSVVVAAQEPLLLTFLQP
jgi:hypothetical protein